MAKALTDEQIEIIKSTYAQTGRLRESARAAGCAAGTAKKYIGKTDQYEQIRTEKRIDIIVALADAQIVLLRSMLEVETLKKASLSEKSVAFGIVTDKHQLLSGEATERHEHRDTNQARDMLSRRVDELAARRRARDADRESQRATGS